MLRERMLGAFLRKIQPRRKPSDAEILVSVIANSSGHPDISEEELEEEFKRAEAYRELVNGSRFAPEELRTAITTFRRIHEVPDGEQSQSNLLQLWERQLALTGEAPKQNNPLNLLKFLRLNRPLSLRIPTPSASRGLILGTTALAGTAMLTNPNPAGLAAAAVIGMVGFGFAALTSASSKE